MFKSNFSFAKSAHLPLLLPNVCFVQHFLQGIRAFRRLKFLNFFDALLFKHDGFGCSLDLSLNSVIPPFLRIVTSHPSLSSRELKPYARPPLTQQTPNNTFLQPFSLNTSKMLPWSRKL